MSVSAHQENFEKENNVTFAFFVSLRAFIFLLFVADRRVMVGKVTLCFLHM